MSHPSDITLTSGCDVTEAPLPQPSGGVQAVIDGMYTELSRRQDTRQLLQLTRRRHLLALSRQVVVHRMSLMSYMNTVCELLQQSPPRPRLLCTVCMRLREVTSQSVLLLRRLRGDPCLYPIPSPSTQDAMRTIPRVLLLMEVKATLLTEQFIACVLRRVSRVPSEVTQDLCRSLAVYNKVVADLSKRAGSMAEMKTFSLSRMLEILAEERGRVLAEELCHMWSQCGLDDVLRKEMETPITRDPALRPSCSLQGVPHQRSPNRLGVLLKEDRSQVTSLLQILAGLDQKMWSQVPATPEPALYSQYGAHLWAAFCAHIFHAVFPGMRGMGVPPSLPEKAFTSAVQILQDLLMSEDLPEPCVLRGRSLCQRLLCVRSLISWDSALCQALSSALTDKCAPSVVRSEDPISDHHSRTSGILVALCQHLSHLLVTPNSSHQSPPQEPRNLRSPSSELTAVISQQGVLSRCAVTLHLCDVWLRSRSQMYTASGSLSQLVLITHGDLPVIKEKCRSLVAATGSADGYPSTQRSCMKIKRSWDVLESLVVSLPHVLSSVCSRQTQELLQHMMPAGRHWRGKQVTGPDPAPSEYVQAAVSMVLVPVLDGVTALCPEEQVSAVRVTLGVFMEAWMGHILREKIKFSLQGALQLRRDFESVRDVLRSRESRLPPEVLQAALALPVFAQADNAIVCLLQQPSQKSYLQSGGCAVFSCCAPLCRVAVDSMSDSLQSLDSLERRVWDRDLSRHVPRHSHDSYLPHNQCQWLSLRVHKTWNGLSLPLEGPEMSEG